MLIITRRAGEKIRVSNDICIEVIEVTGSTVRIGIAAPRSIPVYREEIWAAVQAENAAAAKAPAQLPEAVTDLGKDSPNVTPHQHQRGRPGGPPSSLADVGPDLEVYGEAVVRS